MTAPLFLYRFRGRTEGHRLFGPVCLLIYIQFISILKIARRDFVLNGHRGLVNIKKYPLK